MTTSTTSNLDLIRRMPTDRATAFAKGIMSLLDFRPDLRRQYSAADLAYLQSLVDRSEKQRYAKALADLHSGLLNDILDAGQPIASDILDACADDGVCLHYAKQRWEVLEYAAARAPKGGITIGGKQYRGGQWIPGSVMANAPESVKQKIQGDSQQRKLKRAAKGPVDKGDIDKRLKPHLRHKLTAQESSAAKRSLRALRDHHGDLTAHRIEELISTAEIAHAQAGDGEAKTSLSRRLKILHTMLDEEIGSQTPNEPDPEAVHLPALIEKVRPYEDAELSHGDVMAGVARWEAIQQDYGDFVPQHLDDLADHYLKTMKEGLRKLPKGAKESRATIVRENSKQLALIAWMAERYADEQKEPEPDFAEALDRIAFAEKARSGKAADRRDGTKSTAPWTTYLIKSIRNEFSLEEDDYSDEQVWNRLKEGRFSQEKLKKSLAKIPREYGTMSVGQLKKVLPHLDERTDTITPEIIRRVASKKAKAG